MNAATNWICGALGSLALLCLSACLDAPTAEAQAVADDTTHAMTMARAVAARDALARRMCEAELGHGAMAQWTHDGDFVCRLAAPRLAQGGAP